ncbi:prismalin-14-like [Artemia franciscana]|uniref:prismalin-14-like n=1 Tax=Artemia franciscana TaxID=6661 RepID=UPI0032DA9ED1
MISKLTLLAFVVCGFAALVAGMPEETAERSYESASAYRPSYSSYRYPEGRVKIQVYRGPSAYGKGYSTKGGYGGYGFAPWGYYAQQPIDYRRYGIGAY